VGVRLRAEDKPAANTGAVEYVRDIKPILSQNCYFCHGPAVSKGGLRLDRVELIRTGGSGGPALVAGKIGESLLVARVTGARRSMPPRDAGTPLTEEQVRLLKTWIDQGAKAPVEPGPTGNQLDHDLLFSGKANAPLDNPPRLWRYSPEIYAALMNGWQRPGYPLGRAMTQPPGNGFKDLAGGLTVDEGTLSVLVRNAERAAALVTDHTIENGKVVMRPGADQNFAPLLDPARAPARAEIERTIKGLFIY
jgi:hypothetical protein